MATRRRGGRPQVAVVPVYEEFKPISERIQEKEAEILLVRLPGFSKEQIRVSTESAKLLRIRGERLVAGNKWSRFVQDYDISDNCIRRQITAKFEGGVLTITMPRKSVITQLDSTAEAITTAKASSSQEPAKDSKLSNIQEDIHRKPERIASETKPQKVQDDTPKKVTSINHGKEQIERKDGIESTSTRKGIKEPVNHKAKDDTPPPKENLTSPDGEQREEAYGSLASRSYRKTTKEETSQNGGQDEAAGAKNPKNAIHEAVNKKRSREASEEPIEASKRVFKRVAGTEKEETDGTVGKLGSYKQALKGLAKGINEERQLMVNLGTAVLVAVALGAYISNSFGSSVHNY